MGRSRPNLSGHGQPRRLTVEALEDRVAVSESVGILVSVALLAGKAHAAPPSDCAS